MKHRLIARPRIESLLVVVLASALLASGSAIAANRCTNALRALMGAGDEHSFNVDFGPGVFVRKLDDRQFQIEPPPIVLDSPRKAQLHLAKLSEEHKGDDLTILFANVSEQEAVTFRLMLERDARVESDERLYSVLVDSSPDPSAETEYEGYRERAREIRAVLLERYDWKSAAIERTTVTPKSANVEAYSLTLPANRGNNIFLFKVYLKAAKYAKDRLKAIQISLQRPELKNATPEQAARSLITELKKSDPGIRAGTLKVMSADFIIAQSDLIRYQ